MWPFSRSSSNSDRFVQINVIKVVEICAALLIVGGSTTILLQIGLYIIASGKGVWTLLSSGLWSGLAAIAVGVQALLTVQSATKVKFTILRALIVTDLVVIFLVVIMVLVPAWDDDYCSEFNKGFSPSKCKDYVATYLAMGVVSLLEVPFLLMLTLTSGMCSMCNRSHSECEETTVVSAVLPVDNHQQHTPAQENQLRQQQHVQGQQYPHSEPEHYPSHKIHQQRYQEQLWTLPSDEAGANQEHILEARNEAAVQQGQVKVKHHKKHKRHKTERPQKQFQNEAHQKSHQDNAKIQKEVQQRQNTIAGLGKAALVGVLDAASFEEISEQGGEMEEEPIVAEEFVGDLASAAVTAGLDSIEPGEMDPNLLAQDLIGAGVGTIGGAMKESKSKKWKKFGRGLSFITNANQEGFTEEEPAPAGEFVGKVASAAITAGLDALEADLAEGDVSAIGGAMIESMDQQQKENTIAGLGKAALAGALGAAGFEDLAGQGDEMEGDPTVAEEFVGEVAGAAVTAGLDALQGEFDPSSLAQDLAGAGVGAIGGAMMGSKNKKWKKLGRGLNFLTTGSISQGEDIEEEPTVAEEFVGKVAISAVTAGLDAIESGEFDPSTIAQDLAETGMSAMESDTIESKNEHQRQNTMAGLGKAALGGALGAVGFEGLVGQDGEMEGDPTVAEEFVGEVAGAAVSAGLDALQGEFDPTSLAQDLAGAGVGALGGAMMNSKSKKWNKLGRGLSLLTGASQEEEAEEEPTIAEEFVGDVAGAAVTAGLDALQSGEIDTEALGDDLAAAGMEAVTGKLMSSKNKKFKKVGMGLKFLGKLKEAKENVEENMEE